MRKKSKIIAAMMLFALTLTLLPANNAYAAEAIQPYYLHIINMSASVSSDGTVSASMIGKSTVLKCAIDATLQKYSGGKWVDVKSWSILKEATTASLKESNSLSAGRYRVSCTFTAYKFDRKESVDIISDETTIS